MNKQIKEYLNTDAREIYGGKGVESKYPHQGDIPFKRILVTTEQNKKRVQILMTYLNGTAEQVDISNIPVNLINKCKFVNTKKAPVFLLKAGKKSAIVQPYGEHFFRADFFINEKYYGGNHDMSLDELSSWFDRDEYTNPFSPGII